MDVCPLTGATATSTNVFFCNGRDCHPPRIVDEKNGRFSITDYVFFPISLKPMVTFSTLARTLDCSVFAQCLKPVSHVSHGEFLLRGESRQHASGNRCKTERQRGKRRFCDQFCRVDVKEKSTEQYWESFSPDSQRVLF